MSQDDFAFPQGLVRGLGAAPAGATRLVDPAPQSSSTAPHLVPQTGGDPNYYPTAPQFDSRGFWHSAGSFSPVGSPKGNPTTPSQGEWVKQGTTTRNGLSTPVWVWYPPSGNKPVLLEGTSGLHDYIISRQNVIVGSTPPSKHLFSNPDYWAVEVYGPWKDYYPKQSHSCRVAGRNWSGAGRHQNVTGASVSVRGCCPTAWV
jgi:hypothetical protein